MNVVSEWKELKPRNQYAEALMLKQFCQKELAKRQGNGKYELALQLLIFAIDKVVVFW